MRIQNFPANKFCSFNKINVSSKNKPELLFTNKFTSVQKANLKANTTNVNDSLRYYFMLELDKQHEFYKKFLLMPGKLTNEQYAIVKNSHPYAISRAMEICAEKGDYSPRSTPKQIADGAIALKKYYDFLYGENQYKILSIGTSPAPFTEAMNLMGCDVIFAPISKLRRPGEEVMNGHKKVESAFPNVKTMMEYCTRQGIADQTDKKLIVLDYTYTGESLEAMIQLLKEREDIPTDNIMKHSLSTDLQVCFARKDVPSFDFDALNSINYDLLSSNVEQMCNMPHFYMNENVSGLSKPNSIFACKKNSNDLIDEFDRFSMPKGRAWALCIAHEIFNHRRFI